MSEQTSAETTNYKAESANNKPRMGPVALTGDAKDEKSINNCVQVSTDKKSQPKKYLSLNVINLWAHCFRKHNRFPKETYPELYKYDKDFLKCGLLHPKRRIALFINELKMDERDVFLFQEAEDVDDIKGLLIKDPNYDYSAQSYPELKKALEKQGYFVTKLSANLEKSAGDDHKENHKIFVGTFIAVKKELYVEGSESSFLFSDGDGVTKGKGQCSILIKWNDELVPIVNLHLSYPKMGDVQAYQLQEVLGKLACFGKDSIIGGDINTIYKDMELALSANWIKSIENQTSNDCQPSGKDAMCLKYVLANVLKGLSIAAVFDINLPEKVKEEDLGKIQKKYNLKAPIDVFQATLLETVDKYNSDHCPRKVLIKKRIISKGIRSLMEINVNETKKFTGNVLDSILKLNKH